MTTSPCDAEDGRRIGIVAAVVLNSTGQTLKLQADWR
jgi:hypothetical protein